MRLSYLLMVLLPLIAACKKEKVHPKDEEEEKLEWPSPITSLPPGKAPLISSVYINGTLRNKWEYDDQNRLVRLFTGFTNDSAKGLYPTHKHLFEYGPDGQVVRSISYGRQWNSMNWVVIQDAKVSYKADSFIVRVHSSVGGEKILRDNQVNVLGSFDTVYIIGLKHVMYRRFDYRLNDVVDFVNYDGKEDDFHNFSARVQRESYTYGSALNPAWPLYRNTPYLKYWFNRWMSTSTGYFELPYAYKLSEHVPTTMRVTATGWYVKLLFLGDAVFTHTLLPGSDYIETVRLKQGAVTFEEYRYEYILAK